MTLPTFTDGQTVSDIEMNAIVVAITDLQNETTGGEWVELTLASGWEHHHVTAGSDFLGLSYSVLGSSGGKVLYIGGVFVNDSGSTTSGPTTIATIPATFTTVNQWPLFRSSPSIDLLTTGVIRLNSGSSVANGAAVTIVGAVSIPLVDTAS